MTYRWTSVTVNYFWSIIIHWFDDLVTTRVTRLGTLGGIGIRRSFISTANDTNVLTTNLMTWKVLRVTLWTAEPKRHPAYEWMCSNCSRVLVPSSRTRSRLKYPMHTSHGTFRIPMTPYKCMDEWVNEWMVENENWWIESNRTFSSPTQWNKKMKTPWK